MCVFGVLTQRKQLKYFNFLHELCVSASADRADKQSKQVLQSLQCLTGSCVRTDKCPQMMSLKSESETHLLVTAEQTSAG